MKKFYTQKRTKHTYANKIKEGHQGNFKSLYSFKRKFRKHGKHITQIGEQKEKMQGFYALEKHLSGRKSIFRLYAFCVFGAFYAFCAFAWLRLCTFYAFLCFLCFLCV